MVIGVLLRRVACVGAFFNVVYETIQWPLCVDFRATAECKPIQLFVVRQIRKHGFDGRKALCILRES